MNTDGTNPASLCAPARELGDPLRRVVEAPNKLIAEETAARLGFGDPWAHPVTSQQARHAQWLHKRRPGHRQELAHKPSRGHPHLIKQHQRQAVLELAFRRLRR